MRILIFGASGQTGHELLAQAIPLGHEVTAFVRNAGKLGQVNSRVHVIHGDITDAATVNRAVEGHDAVLSVLGAPTPIRPYPAFRTGIENIIRAMEAAAVRRFIYLSFLGVRAGAEDLGFFFNHVAARLLRHAIADHAANEYAIRTSRLAWTIVHPPKLTRGRRTSYRSGEQLTITSVVPSISRADVADFMLQQLTEDRYVLRSPRIMN